jgi:hypothetical protein
VTSRPLSRLNGLPADLPESEVLHLPQAQIWLEDVDGKPCSEVILHDFEVRRFGQSGALIRSQTDPCFKRCPKGTYVQRAIIHPTQGLDVGWRFCLPIPPFAANGCKLALMLGSGLRVEFIR